MRNVSLFFLGCALSGFLLSCDKVDEPYERRTPVPEPEGGQVRKVLLEDFTGHRCPNCPEAADEIVALQRLFGDRMVVVAVHTTREFAAPYPPDYPPDYRTPAGATYYADYGMFFLPVGLINRLPMALTSTEVWISHGDWSAVVPDRVNDEPELGVAIGPVSLDPATRRLRATITVVPYKNLSGDRNLTLYLTEDHIISPQLNGATRIAEYEHRHVLRDTPLGARGVPLIIGGAALGDTLTYDLDYVVPSGTVEFLDAANCALVAYTYDVDSPSREVTQVEERKVGQ